MVEPDETTGVSSIPFRCSTLACALRTYHVLGRSDKLNDGAVELGTLVSVCWLVLLLVPIK